MTMKDICSSLFLFFFFSSKRFIWVVASPVVFPPSHFCTLFSYLLICSSFSLILYPLISPRHLYISFLVPLCTLSVLLLFCHTLSPSNVLSSHSLSSLLRLAFFPLLKKYLGSLTLPSLPHLFVPSSSAFPRPSLFLLPLLISLSLLLPSLHPPHIRSLHLRFPPYQFPPLLSLFHPPLSTSNTNPLILLPFFPFSPVPFTFISLY